MTTAGPAAVSTPKRKRSQLENDDADVPLLNAFSPADIALPLSSPADDGGTSPRTNVAHRFRSLAIGRPRSSAEINSHARFAPHTIAPTTVIPETPQPNSKSTSTSSATMAKDDDEQMDCGVRKKPKMSQGEDEEEATRPPTEDEGDLPNTPPQPKPRNKPAKPAPTFAVERPATPPLRKATPPATDPADATTASTPTAQPGPTTFQWPPSPPPSSSISPQREPVSVAFRASMTWQEDEITIYDPDDSDDDGTGINGIGFKPTAAVAYARGVKRKQQLAEYRKREEREARARRSQRRRGASPRPVGGGGGGEEERVKKPGMGEQEKRKEKERRRVRFLEASVGTAAVATGS